MKNKTMVIGASANTSRYSNRATKMLLKAGKEVVLIGRKPAVIYGQQIVKEKINHEDIDTVTLYVNPKYQAEYYNYILDLKPRRIIFNPGTENSALQDLAKNAGIETLQACTLVMLSIGNY